MDRIAAVIVRLGGIAIIMSILAILIVIVGEVVPLLRSPTAEPLKPISSGADSPVLAIAVDEYRDVAAIVREAGISFISLESGSAIESAAALDLAGASVVSVAGFGGEHPALGLSDGRVLPVSIMYARTKDGDRWRTEPAAAGREALQMDPAKRPLARIAYASPESGPVAAAQLGTNEIAFVKVSETTSMMGETSREETRSSLKLPTAEVAALTIDSRGDYLFAGTADGSVVQVSLRDPKKPTITEPVAVSTRSGAAITSLGFLLGDRTLVVGDAAGGVSTWQLLRDAQKRFGLIRVNRFADHVGAVTGFSHSLRNKAFVTSGADGEVRFHYGTTGKTLLDLGADSLRSAAAVVLAPRGNGILAIGTDGEIHRWEVHAPHPEVSFRALFGKLLYEGYDEPAYVWQSTGGTDDFEPKLSLTPLLYGTLKGTFYALLFAIPLAVLSALYAAQFMHPSLRSFVKPAVEVMAALPSVVLGFIAGLWLAPVAEPIVPGLFLMPIVATIAILATVWGWRLLPQDLRVRLRAGTEIFVLLPVVLFAGWLSIELGHVFEAWILGGDYRIWIASALGLTYDQRNSLVVGMAMGFAVIPVIFTIAEDSLSSVPPHLNAGSLALGATPWQTALRVVLPSASPGIFSAIMVGFGRAVGETMIVLMATGNTPVMDFSAFSGFRALSANIAVELPEAPEHGTLFRILFLAAFLLFVITFCVNTLAELVRVRLRQKYRTL